MFRAILSVARPSLQLLRDITMRSNGFHSMNTSMQSPCATIAKPELGSLFTQIRNKVRCYFPRPKETHRIRKHGWERRLSTAGGRRVLMRRLLKGRYVLSH